MDDASASTSRAAVHNINNYCKITDEKCSLEELRSHFLELFEKKKIYSKKRNETELSVKTYAEDGINKIDSIDSFFYLVDAHMMTNHGDFIEMTKLLETRYRISKDSVKTFLEVCCCCVKGDLIPITHTKETQKFQTVEAAIYENGPQNYLVYIDKDTRFTLIRSISTTTTKTKPFLSLVLLKLFTDFGPPKYLLNSKKHERLFYNALKELKTHFGMTTLCLRSDIGEPPECEVIKELVANSELDMSLQCTAIQWKLNNSRRGTGGTPFMCLFENHSTAETSETV